MKDVTELLGRRVLVDRGWTLKETHVLEISPDGKFVRLEWDWYRKEEVKVVSVLNDDSPIYFNIEDNGLPF